MSTIVVGYVLRPEGEAALEWAISQAKEDGDRLVIMHSSRGGDHDDPSEYIKYREAGEQIEKRLDAEGIADRRLVGLVLGHKPVEDIVDIAEEESADLIVIGVRRRSTLGKLILGSNAQEIIMDAPCPVLTVKADG